MRKKIHVLFILCTILITGLFSGRAVAQDGPQPVTIRQLNTYENLTSFSDIPNHPLAGEPVQFTAVIASYPRSSGLASFNEATNSIGRIHVFIADTTANTLGRDGMYIQVVQPSGNPEFDQLEQLTRGTVITVEARLTFFNSVAQVIIDEIISVDGNVFGDAELEKYAPLTEPMEVSPSEFHNVLEPGVIQLDLDGYQKFNGMYISISGATTSNTTFDDRPNIRTNSGGSFVYNRDISLRYRNDRPNYRTGYNFRRPDIDGDFVPPLDGSQVNISGFLVIDDFNVDNHFPAGEGAFFISPMEDGVLWLNDERLVDGEVVDGEPFEWPVDFEVLSQPARIVDATLSPDPAEVQITSSDAITVTATAIGPDDDPSVTVDEVWLFWSGTGIEADSVLMNNIGGDDYQATLPTFPNFTSVSVFMEVTDSNDGTSRFPAGGDISFFVADSEITSIELIQKTGNEGDGPSPLVGSGVLPMDITATIVSGADDGVIIAQDAAAEWSGVFLELNTDTQDLQRGDVINITAAETMEADVASNSNTYTYLTNIEFTVTGTGSVDAMVPVLTTDEILAVTDPGEAFEGVLVKVLNTEIIEILGFGEFRIGTIPAGGETPTTGIVVNDDTRAGVVGETGFPDDVNIHARLGGVLDEFYAFGTFTFGEAKFIPRDLGDLVGNNFTIPRLEFNLLTPEDEALVSVTGDIGITWEALTPPDYDGDEVTYEWVLYEPDTQEEIVALASDNNGADAVITLPFETVDNLLESRGLSVGETADFLWNVRVSDGTDTLPVAAFFDFDTDEFVTQFNAVTLERNQATSIDDEEGLSGIPRSFDLKQNYPNPFNPSTVIRYAVPEASNVRIDVFNILGQRVTTLVNREHRAGNFDVTFDASNLSSGMYFYRLEAANTVLTQKMMLIK